MSECLQCLELSSANDATINNSRSGKSYCSLELLLCAALDLDYFRAVIALVLSICERSLCFLTASMSTSAHPFYPSTITLANIYAPNDLAALTILAIFSAVCAIVLLPAFAVARKYNHSLSAQDQALVLWFVLCA